MSPEQIEKVQSSFARVEPIADQAAALFYGRLFEQNPGFRRLFKGDLQRQGGMLMATLALAVKNLHQPERILSAVQELGRRHVGYGVTAADYAPVGEALIWTLEQGLGAHFTTDVRAAWVAAYRLLSGVMVQAAEG